MLTAIFVGIPIFLIVAGTVAALSFAVDTEPEVQQAAAQPRLVVGDAVGSMDFTALPMGVQDPANQTSSHEPMPVEDLLKELEMHLRQERQVAAEFARDPSSRSLWLN